MSEIHVKVTANRGRKFLTMYYDDPVTGKREQRSSKQTRRREAERAAAKWEAELREGRYCRNSRMAWADFRRMYEDEHLASLADKTEASAASAFNHLERIINPKRLASLTETVLSRFQRELREGSKSIDPQTGKELPTKGLAENSIASHLRHIRAALNWAAKKKLLASAPDITMPKRAKGKKGRGRPITGEEFDRMLAAVEKVRQRDAEAWRHYLTGLWLSGLRLEESLALTWDDAGDITIDLSGRHPRLRIYAEAEKAHRDRLLPITPDFAEFLLATPEAERTGPVFKLLAQNGEPLDPKHVSKVVSAIGRKARIVVNSATGKVASAHDLRRTFGTRWAKKVTPAILQQLMRHESVETTMGYYVDLAADDVAAQLWADHTPAVGAEKVEVGTFVGNGVSDAPQGDEPADDWNAATGSESNGLGEVARDGIEPPQPRGV